MKKTILGFLIIFKYFLKDTIFIVIKYLKLSDEFISKKMILYIFFFNNSNMNNLLLARVRAAVGVSESVAYEGFLSLTFASKKAAEAANIACAARKINRYIDDKYYFKYCHRGNREYSRQPRHRRESMKRLVLLLDLAAAKAVEAKEVVIEKAEVARQAANIAAEAAAAAAAEGAEAAATATAQAASVAVGAGREIAQAVAAIEASVKQAEAAQELIQKLLTASMHYWKREQKRREQRQYEDNTILMDVFVPN